MCVPPLAPLRCVLTPSQQWQSRDLHSRYTRLLFLPDAGAQHSKFSTEQTQRDRKSDTDTTWKHLVNFQKTLRVDADQISLIFIKKMSLCAELGLKSTHHSFSEVAIVRDSVITAKCHLATPAVRPCCALKHSRWMLMTKYGANLQRSSSVTDTQPVKSLGYTFCFVFCDHRICNFLTCEQKQHSAGVSERISINGPKEWSQGRC